uniref:Uncharacterized protein n=1 Tax=Cryptomonas curvata TaxID=233186 RepID=A0A7S0QQ92_9CRYP
MKSDNTWDLGTGGRQQRLLIPTAGVTAAYAEQAHKVTLNASSDIFARCSKLQTSVESRLTVAIPTRSRARCSKHFHSRNDNSSATIIPVLVIQRPRNALIELTFKLP